MTFSHVGFPIRTSPDRGPFAPPRSFSQLITSFLASESLGIRHAPLLTSFLKANTSRVAMSHAFIFLLVVHHVKDLSTITLTGDSTAVLLVENNGFEPLTPCLQSRCSSQLS